jgi:antitoxin component YwqK of YwqJK toxin-antitoxin module
MNRLFFKITNLFKSNEIDFEELKLHCVIVSQRFNANESYIISIRECNSIEELKVVIEQKLDMFCYFYEYLNEKIPLPNGTYTMLYDNGKKGIEFTLKNGKFIGESLAYYKNGLLNYKTIRDMKGRITHLEAWSSDGALLILSKHKGDRTTMIYS